MEHYIPTINYYALYNALFGAQPYFWSQLYDVWYIIVIIGYLQVIHMKIPFQDYVASNSVSTVSTLVIHFMLKYRMSGILSYLFILCASSILQFLFSNIPHQI